MYSPERQYAEEFAIGLESMGLARAYGKLLGWLMICDPPQQSSAELAAALEISKGSVSAGTRLLENAGMIRRVVAPGQRGKAYEVSPDAIIRAVQDNRYQTFLDLLERGLAVVGDERAPRADRLRRNRDFYAFIARELPKLVERFESEYGEDDNG
jgi:DNA-binding transcriptional regulator GbsR (MarR family)